MTECLIYFIEPAEQDDIDRIIQSIAVPVYGASMIQRNLKVLQNICKTVIVVFRVTNDWRAHLGRPINDFVVCQGVFAFTVNSDADLSIDDLLDRTNCNLVPKWAVFQRGIGLLQREFSTKSQLSDNQISKHLGRWPSISSRRFDALASEASEEELIAIQSAVLWDSVQEGNTAKHSTAKIPWKAFDHRNGSIVEQLKFELHERAASRSLDGPISRLFRHLTPLLSRPLARIGLHPNTATIAAAIFSLIGIVLLAHGGRAHLVAGGIFWLLGGLLDEVDGELARLQAKESEFGAWLDLSFDRILDALVLVALVWPVFLVQQTSSLFLITTVSIGLVATSSYVGLLYDRWMKEVGGKTKYFRIGRDTRNLSIFVGALFNLRVEGLCFIAIISAFETIRRLVVCWRHDTKRQTSTEIVGTAQRTGLHRQQFGSER